MRYLIRALCVLGLMVLAGAAHADSLGSAIGGTAGNQSNMAGCIYTSTPPNLSNGQQAGIRCNPDGSLIIGSGSNLSRVLTAADATLTRPANATATAANNCFGASSNCILTWTNFFSANGNTGIMTGMKIAAAAASIGVANMPTLVAHIYTASPSSPPSGDAQPCNLLNANQAIEIATVTFSTWNIGNSGSDMVDSYGVVTLIPQQIRAGSSSRNMYSVICTTNVVTPVASTVLTAYASMLQD